VSVESKRELEKKEKPAAFEGGKEGPGKKNLLIDYRTSSGNEIGEE